ncbi:MAG: prevent-host-death family protein [Tardiphaga sp.]|uniref:type II toxin-antitoxin system Phd/YefM family antitoxin n=1 Tax=Tardiphaga sp. TaxID=1926292 RepID=UPI002620FB8F|nr:type II toxin-antitoxin system prevent-host-death family antitoxin [Tardiphaga sp.]MDB5501522.1 prevent-host-death family protein [Tardiphaga sp.]
MKTLQLRDAKAGFSAIVEAAENGQPTIVTKHGRPAAMVVPFEEGQRLYPDDRPSFAEVLMGMPYALEIERDPSPVREIEL